MEGSSNFKALGNEYLSLIENLGSLVVTMDKSGRVTYINRASRFILGKSQIEVFGEAFVDYLDKYSKRNWKQMLSNNLDGILTAPVEVSVTVQNKKKILEVNSAPYLKEGKISGVICTIADRTELKHMQAEKESQLKQVAAAERAMSKSMSLAKKYTDTILANVPVSILVVNDNLLCKSANKIFYKTFRKDPKSTIGFFIQDVMPSKIVNTYKVQKKIKYAIETKKFIEIPECPCNDKIFNIKIIPITMKVEEMTMVTEVVIEDITKIKKVETEIKVKSTQLEEYNKRLQKLVTIIDCSYEAIALIDLENTGMLTYVNPSWEKMFGYNSKEVLNKRKGLILDAVDKDPNLKYKLEQARQRKSRFSAEMEWVHKSGKKIPVEINVFPIMDGNNNIISWANVVQDITERKKSQEEFKNKNFELTTLNRDLQTLNASIRDKSGKLEIANKGLKNAYYRLKVSKGEIEKLKELDKIKTDFLNITSHELRTPLTPIQAHLELLYDNYLGKLNKEQSKSVGVVLDSVNRFSKLINDILDVARFNAKKTKIILDKSNLETIIKKSIENVSPEAKLKKILITKKIKKLPLVYFNKEKITQVMLNLLNNAIKFTSPNGRILIKARPEKEFIVVSVKDSGIGISKENLEKLFVPFSQADSSISRKYGGSGLGLTICENIIKMHHGKIRVSSQLKKGSIFSFTLPIKKFLGQTSIEK